MTPRILVVDDEPAIADTLAAVLRKFGYAVEVAYDAEEALHRLASFQPALLISDVVMPLGNGVELAIQLRRSYPDCKVLLLSGHTTTEDLLQQATQSGYTFEVLPKPIHPRQLLPRIAELLRHTP